MLQTAEMEHKLLLALVHWTLSVWDMFMPHFVVYFMRFVLTPYKTLHYVSDMIFNQVRAREVKLFLNHSDSHLFSGLGSHDHNFSSEVRKCDCEGLTGRNLNVIVFQNN
jgi:hypothetical protein